MAVVNFTPLLGLALPDTGDLSGTWGATVNTAITDLLDDAVAGTATLTTDANVTLTTTNGVDNQARNAIILCTGARTAIRTITAPAQSKVYVIVNATSGGFAVKIVGAGPTTGVTVAANTQVIVAWNGSDFVVTATGDLVGPSSATDTAITLFDGATGKLVKNSLVTVSAAGAIVAPQAGSTIPFYFANQAAFPSAASYHGALAHSHSDGAMYFAHSSAWVRLLDASTTVTVAQGGTGLTTGTSGGVLAYTASGTLASSGVLAQYGVVIGGGAGAVPTSTAVGIATHVLTSNGSGVAPTFQAPAAGGTTIPSGTVMLFQQTSAPTGFTKLTTHDNKALRVVSGTASSGGSVGFTTAFASQAVSGTLDNTTVSVSVSISSVSGTVGSTTLTTSQIPSHRHLVTNSGSSYTYGAAAATGNANGYSWYTDYEGGGTSHNHSFSGSGSGSGSSSPHNHNFTGTAINLAVQYVDIILASKD